MRHLTHNEYKLQAPTKKQRAPHLQEKYKCHHSSKEAVLVHEALVARGLEIPMRAPVQEIDNETRKRLITGHMTGDYATAESGSEWMTASDGDPASHRQNVCR
ncbi:hypothetical protein MJK72_19940 [Klebsiella pneumoniae]|nr:hypothetical protein MJK72_19940 [Klebsiella pneumoniae]